MSPDGFVMVRSVLLTVKRRDNFRKEHSDYILVTSEDKVYVLTAKELVELA